MAIKNAYSYIDPKRKVLYRNFHEIGDKIKVVYLVEISASAHKIYVILFPNFEKTEVHIAEILPIKIAERLIAACNNVFDKFIDTMQIKFGKLLIAGFNTKVCFKGRSKSIATG